MPREVIPLGSTFPVNPGGAGQLTPTQARNCRTLDKGTIWELVASRWSGANIPIGGAIVLAESGGKTCARNRNSNGSVDRGMWQINDRAHPDVSDACADDPVCSTNVAKRLFDGRGGKWTDWSTFNSGAYKSFEKGAPSIDDANVEEQGFAQINPLNSAMQFLEKLGVIFERGFWRRAGLVALGLVAAILAIVLIGKEYTPVGMAAKALKG